MYGQFTGYENETPIYQEFAAAAGETFTFSGMAWVAGEDSIAGSTTYAALALKYFDDAYNSYGSDESNQITASSAFDTWTELTVAGTVPAGATKVQAAIEFWHCFGDTSGSCYSGGSVYFDDLVLE